MRSRFADPAQEHAWRWAEFKAVLSLRHGLPGGPLGLRPLLDAYPDCQQAVADCSQWLSRRVSTPRRQAAFARRDWLDKARAEYERVQELKMRFVLWHEQDYPALLRHLPDAPPVLYFTGDQSLFEGRCLAVVGSRKASRRACEMAYALSGELSAAGISVVSGLAYGVDRQAHLGGLSGLGSSVAVIGTGLDVLYPSDNRDIWAKLSQQGLIVSEFAPGARPMPHHFPIRNRVMSGLSLGVLVVEAQEKSGSRITARLSMEQGREVFVLPGSAGCDALIESGATAVSCCEDILRALAPQFGLAGSPARQHVPQTVAWDEQEDHCAPDVQPPEICLDVLDDMPPQARQLYELLHPSKAHHVDELSRALQLDAAQTNRHLVALELEGLAKRKPGMLFVRA